MVKLAEYKRTATFAWSHDRTPVLVTGTAAGTVDADFSSDSTLELWSLLAAAPDTPLCSLTTDARFNDLDWSHDGKFIAGAMDSGAVEIFGTNNERSALHSFAKHSKHSAAATTVRFNPKQANLLLSGGSTQGEIFIWDTTKCVAGAAAASYSPVLPGNAKTALDEIKSLAWNNAMPQVFASAGNTTYASIWDLKAKREVLHLDYTSPDNGARAQFSVVEWHPSSSTKVATASGNDADPIVAVWDLREANKPLQVLRGAHSKGIMSLDWCAHDDALMLTAGRDNSVMLWNPDDGQLLSQFPARSNWCFKAQFAPECPDIFAAASFDGRVQVQTLQNIETSLDAEQSASKSAESETDFWNNVSTDDGAVETQKPTVSRLQAPAWYGTANPAANWAFGGKLVSIMPDGRSVAISKPVIQGMEPNEMLGDAFRTKDFVPLINVRLARALDKNNEDDWGLLEKLSMDGKTEFLKDAFALDGDDDEEEEKSQDIDDGAKFFSKMETAFTPEGAFKLSGDAQESISRDLIAGKLDAAVAKCLDNDMLLEALVIALDTQDATVRDIVKNVYFAKNANESALSRVMYATQKNDIDDLVDNLDLQQWKYAVKAIYSQAAADETRRNGLLVKLGQRLLDNDMRQDALVLFFAANSLDKVASIWLKEFKAMEDSLKAANKTVYEAHSECLTEFIEKFTVLSSFLGGNLVINSDELIAKFLEFVNLTSASGNFDLAAAFLENLPGDNEEVNTEKQRVQIASGKAVKTATTARTQQNRARTTNNYVAQPAQPAPFGLPTPATSAPAAQPLPLPQAQPAQIPSGNRAMAGKYAPAMPAAAPGPAPMAPTATTMGQFAPVANQQPVSSFVQPSQSFVQPANPYTPAGTSASPVGAFGQPQQANNGMAPPPQTGMGMASGQTPHLNKKANDGWNDLPLSVEKKQGRAKAVSVAPVNVGVVPGSVNGSPQMAGGNMPPPPISRMASTASIPPPMGRGSRKASQAGLPTPEAALPPVPKMPNPYAPQEVTTPAAAASPQFPPMGNVPTPVNPYAPPPQAAGAAGPGNNVSNPYAPPPQAAGAAGFSTPSRASPYVPSRDATPHSSSAAVKKMNSAYAPQTQNPYAPAQPSAMGGAPGIPSSPAMAPPTSLGAPPMNRGQNNSVQHSPLQQPVGPPPMSMKRKPHTNGNAEDAANLLDSMKRNAPPQASTTIPQGAAPAAVATPAPAAASPAPAQAPPAAAAVATQAPAEPMSADLQELVDFFKAELSRVAPLIPQEYSKQLKDCQKRLTILFGHLERGDLVTAPTIAKLKELVDHLKSHDYKEAMRVHVDIATNHAQEGGNWLTGVKRLINIAEATAN
ncbi:Sec31 protein [Maudiozyma humilis]|uniref:Protein transport protein SEC31 n=1 Tax=Maudiozyma humilis TaxID=51915 RepID=A0AAV5RY41_MAUHU|nr:Sec31 protein [Kazachstania humilis]